MKKLFTLFAVALMCTLCAQAQNVEPADGGVYVIKNVRSGLYISLTVGSDAIGDKENASQASIAAVGTPFTFNGTKDAFTLTTEDGKVLGKDTARDWNVSSTISFTWKLTGNVNGYNIVRSNYNSKALGMDNYTAGSGIYTDKSANSNNSWVFEVYEAPAEKHTVTVSIDGAEAVDMNGTEELGYVASIIVATGSHTAVVSYDGQETTYTFETQDFRADNMTFTDGYVKVMYLNGEVSVEGSSVIIPLYIVGIDGVWDAAAPSMTVKNVNLQRKNTWTIEYTVEPESTAFFALGTALGTSSDDWATFNNHRLGAPEKDYAISTVENATATLVANTDSNFKLVSGTWTLVVDLDENTLTVSKYTAPETEGISSVAISNNSTRLFDLQGRAVRAQKGIMIANGQKVIR